MANTIIGLEWISKRWERRDKFDQLQELRQAYPNQNIQLRISEYFNSYSNTLFINHTFVKVLNCPVCDKTVESRAIGETSAFGAYCPEHRNKILEQQQAAQTAEERTENDWQDWTDEFDNIWGDDPIS